MYKFKAFSNPHSVEVEGVRINTSALEGFVYSLRAIPFDDIMVVLDGLPQHSNTILPNYKGTRNHESDEGLSVSKLEVAQFLTRAGERVGKTVTVVCSPLQETDQVISSVVHYVCKRLPQRWRFMHTLNTKPIEDDPMLRRYAPVTLSPLNTEYLDQFDSVVIASTDADFVQLLRFGNVYIDTSTSGTKICAERVTDSTAQMSPVASVVYKCIFGDSSDNVPSIPMVDTKRAKSVISDISDERQMMDFFEIMDNGRTSGESSLSPSQSRLALEIYASPYRSMFRVNRDVTFCIFWSLPSVLSYPDYDIEKTINKYRLRV